MSLSFIPPDLGRIDAAKATHIALFLFQEKKPFQGVASLLDWRLFGHLSNLMIDGFLTGDREETLLVPLNGQMAAEYLLVFGIGKREDFCDRVFFEGIGRLFDTALRVKIGGIAISLPGRLEKLVDGTQAMEWFLKKIDEREKDFKKVRDIHIIEDYGSQKAMAPVLERWRLRHSID